MVEGGAKMVPEDEILEALFFAHETIQPILDAQEQLRAAVGKPKRAFVTAKLDEALLARVKELATPGLLKAYANREKLERYAALDAFKAEFKAQLPPELAERKAEVSEALEKVKKEIVRGDIINHGRRLDGRGLKDVRPISVDVGLLPRTHGSALFTRGETQAIVVTTLGTAADEQRIDALHGDFYKRSMPAPTMLL